MNNLIVTHKVSKKEGRDDFHYLVLSAKMPYGNVQLSNDKGQIAEFVGLAVCELMSLEVDKPFVIGIFEKKEFKK